MSSESEKQNGPEICELCGTFKVDATIDRLKPTRKLMDEIGRKLVETEIRLTSCSQEFHAIIEIQKMITKAIVRVEKKLAKIESKTSFEQDNT